MRHSSQRLGRSEYLGSASPARDTGERAALRRPPQGQSEAPHPAGGALCSPIRAGPGPDGSAPPFTLIDKLTHQSKAAFLRLQPMSEQCLVKRGLPAGARLSSAEPRSGASCPPAGLSVTCWTLAPSGEFCVLGRAEREQDLGEADCDTRGFLTKLSQHGSSRGISLLQRSHPAMKISHMLLRLL